MLLFKEYDSNLNFKSNKIAFDSFCNLFDDLNERDSRIIKLDFEGDIAQFIVKSNSFLIKLYPIAAIFISSTPAKLFIFNTDNNDVDEFCNYMVSNLKKTKQDFQLNMLSFIENLLNFHSGFLDKKIKIISGNISIYNLDNIKSKDLSKIAKIFHDLLLLKNQYQEIQQTLTQINELPNDKLKIVKELNQLEEFSRMINIYQNQFDEDVKTLNRMGKEIEILIQMTDIKFADKRNMIAITSLNLDIIVLIVSFISMFGSIFGMNLDSSLENIDYGLYFVLLFVILFAFLLFEFIKNYLVNTMKI